MTTRPKPKSGTLLAHPPIDAASSGNPCGTCNQTDNQAGDKAGTAIRAQEVVFRFRSLLHKAKTRLGITPAGFLIAKIRPNFSKRVS